MEQCKQESHDIVAEGRGRKCLKTQEMYLSRWWSVGRWFGDESGREGERERERDKP